MSARNCFDQEHRHDPRWLKLSDDQSNPQRHKCCGCAYVQGFNDAKKGRQKNPKTDTWLDSQAGTGRHKNALEAYYLGYNDGTLSKNTVKST